MIYLEETINLEPANPETLDKYIELVQAQLVPIGKRLGFRLVAAWYTDVEWFSQVIQMLEFDDLEAFAAFRAKAGEDSAWEAYAAHLEILAPERRSRLLEPLGPIPPEVLHEAAAQSSQSPLGVYTWAVLGVAPGKMPEFTAAVEAGAKVFPIIASLRTIIGRQNEVTDIWKGSLRQEGYQPTTEEANRAIGRLREMAPRERIVMVFPLPCSPLL
jgi:hypothetical protein